MRVQLQFINMKPLTSHVKPLNGDNYPRWKLEVSTALEAVEPWGHCTGATAEPAPTGSNQDDIAKWKKNDAMARSCIIPLLDDRQIHHVSNLGSAKEIWDKLGKMHDDTSSLNKDQTQTRFFTYQIGTDQSAVEGMEEIEKLANSLAQLGVPQDKTAIISRILTALPSKYASFRMAWDSVAATEQTLENLHIRLRKLDLLNTSSCNEPDSQAPSNVAFAAASGHKEQHRHGGKGGMKKSGNDENQKNQGQNNNSNRKRKGNCNYCSKPGHWARECRSRIRDEEGDNTEGGNQKSPQQNKGKRNQGQRPRDDEGPNACQAFMGLSSPQLNANDVWICDSGASSHFTGRKDWYIQYETLAQPIPIRQTDGNSVNAVGTGTVVIDAWLNQQWVPTPINNVLYIPGASNLFSEAVMDKKGYRIVKEGGAAKFYKNKTLGPQAKLTRGVYVMGFRPREEVAFSAQLWHQRLAHINPHYIKKSVLTGAVSGLCMTDLKDDGNECPDCPMGKATKLPFPTQPNRTTTRGELIHVDLSGRMPTKSLGGAEYFMVMKDDLTQFRHVSFLKRK